MPYSIWEIPEGDKYPMKEIGKTHTPGGALTRMKDEVFFNNEKTLDIIQHPMDEGGGHTVASEGQQGNIIGRTSFHVSQ